MGVEPKTAVSRAEPESGNPVHLVCSPGLGARAAALARESGFVFGGECQDLRHHREPVVLWLDDDGLSLRQTGRGAMGPVAADFAGGAARHRRLYGGGKNQTIAKAVGIKGRIRPAIADLTAGLGGDSFVFAGLGCTVTLIERNPVVRLLLQDALERARAAAESDADLQAVIGRISLVSRSAHLWLEELPRDQLPDVIYLDPMFPERKKKAQVNKAMQLLQQVVGADDDADNLLPLALARARYRVVVKRPSHAPFLNDHAPGYSLAGKSVRFDIYPLKKMEAPDLD